MKEFVVYFEVALRSIIAWSELWVKPIDWGFIQVWDTHS
jgi:hypothetical protein